MDLLKIPPPPLPQGCRKVGAYANLRIISLLLLILTTLAACAAPTKAVAVENRLAPNVLTEGTSVRLGPNQKVKIAAILPKDNNRLFSISKTSPAIDYAIQEVEKRGLLPRHELIVKYLDSNCTSKAAALSAFKFYMEKEVQVFFGPVCDYSLAPVARYAPEWNIPVLSPGGMAHDFSEKQDEYRSLTRVGSTFDSLALRLIDTLNNFNWKSVKVIYSSDGHGNVVSRFCYLAMSGFIKRLRKGTTKFHLYLLKKGQTDFEEMLREEVGTKYAGEFLYILFTEISSAGY